MKHLMYFRVLYGVSIAAQHMRTLVHACYGAVAIKSWGMSPDAFFQVCTEVLQ